MKKGIFIVFEGADGSGKTTIIEALPQLLIDQYNADEFKYYHWRPFFIKSPKKGSNSANGGVVTDPHGKPKYNKIISLSKFLYFNLDYIFGYWFKIRKQINKGNIVVFDRYYYDYYLDKERYRLDISDNILDVFMPLIPKPDITFLLIGDAQRLYERKKELTLIEIQSQIDCLKKNKSKFSNSIIVNVNESIDDTTKFVSREIFSIRSRNCGN